MEHGGRAALGSGIGSLVLLSLPVLGPGLGCVEKAFQCRPETLSESGVMEGGLGGGLGVLAGIMKPGCAEAAGAGPRLTQPSSWQTCPRSSKPSWADQVEEEGEDGESALSPRITTASPPGRHCCLFQSPTLAPPSDPASPLTASPCPAPSLPGPAYLQFQMFTSQFLFLPYHRPNPWYQHSCSPSPGRKL